MASDRGSRSCADPRTRPKASQRFIGGVLRLGGGHAAIEIAMDYRSEVTGDLTERIKSYPIQGSLLLYPVRARLAPYLLGGIGWYTQHVTTLRRRQPATSSSTEETTRKMGYHVGFGGGTPRCIAASGSTATTATR